MNSPADDPRSIPDLFEAVFQPDDDAGWDAVAALHWRGSREVLDRATLLAASEIVYERCRAADILGQLGVPDRTFPKECFSAVLRLLSDHDIDVVFAAILSLQHIDRSRAAARIIPFAHHDDDNIRYAVAVALGAVDTRQAIETLIVLMRDRDPDVRNWATFGLAQQSDIDTGEIRGALAERLSDDDPDTFYEAVIGLGRRRDSRALGFLKTILHDDPHDMCAREAAAKLLGLDATGDMSTMYLLGALQRRQRWRYAGASLPS